MIPPLTAAAPGLLNTGGTPSDGDAQTSPEPGVNPPGRSAWTTSLRSLDRRTDGHAYKEMGLVFLCGFHRGEFSTLVAEWAGLRPLSRGACFWPLCAYKSGNKLTLRSVVLSCL